MQNSLKTESENEIDNIMLSKTVQIEEHYKIALDISIQATVQALQLQREDDYEF